MSRNKIAVILGIGLLVLAVSACSRKQPVLASIGSKIITSTDFVDRLKQLPPQYQGLIRTAEDKKTMLDALVKEQLIVQEAKERNIDQDKAVQAKINTVVDQILLEEMVKRVRETQLRPSEAEMKSYYEQHKSESSAPARVKVAHILVKGKDQAEEILAQLKKGNDFAQAAKENSLDSGSSQQGGELAYFSSGEMVPEFEKAAFALTMPGQLSGVVQSPFGYHIIKLVDRKEAGQKSYEEARPEMERVLEKDKFDKWLNSLKVKWHVKINYDKLSEINIAGAPAGSSEGAK